MNILIVDDHATNLKLLRAQLEAEGHTVLEAGDGVQALAVLEREPVDGIVSDILMPQMDGYGLCRTIRQHPKFSALPLILYTSTYNSDSDRQLAEAVGADRYIEKPAATAVILEALDEARSTAGERKRPQSPLPGDVDVLKQYSDVLVRKLEEKNTELQDALGRLSSIYETVADSLFYLEVEPNGRCRFTSVNQAFVLTTGLEYSRAVGKHVDEVIPEPAVTVMLEKCEVAIREKNIVRWEETSDYPKGRLTCEVSIAPVFHEEGACTHLVGALHDITERKQLEAQFRQSQKMESVGQLAGGIAHDFNNLLTVINGMAELGLEQVSAGDQLHRDLQEIRRAGERAAALTRQLLAFSRKQILQPQVMNLNTVVAEMESLLRRLIGEDVDLVFVPTEDLGNVKVDPGQVEQVVANLALNARDAMPQGGQLTIETRNVELDEQFALQRGVAVPSGRPYVMLAISDTGTGMDDVTRGRIFEPFFTTKAPGQGTGLGLSTVYGIVKQSGGFIWVYSEVGRGTSFKIYLPQVAEVAGGKRQQPTVAAAGGAETILLVEDMEGLRQIAKRMLESAGYTVLLAANGEEALRMLERHEDPVDLIITDVVLPGMSGQNLAKQLDRMAPRTKVLYMSGYTDDVIVRHGVLEEGIAFLAKPFTVVDLTQKVREVLDSQS